MGCNEGSINNTFLVEEDCMKRVTHIDYFVGGGISEEGFAEFESFRNNFHLILFVTL